MICNLCYALFELLIELDRNREVNTSWAPLSAHAGYWKSQGVADLIVEKFSEWKI